MRAVGPCTAIQRSAVAGGTSVLVGSGAGSRSRLTAALSQMPGGCPATGTDASVPALADSTNVDFHPSPRARELLERVDSFMEREIAPSEEAYHRELLERADPWVVLPAIDELKAKARAEGLWNLFLPDEEHGAGLSNVEYAPLAERMGRSLIASEVFNCSAPDTGNMEVLLHFGSDEQKERWLGPLLAGEIRSAFCMTEPEVASSDATNMQATATPEGDEIVVNGRKWWSTGVGHPRCEVLIFMGLSDPEADRYHQHSMVLIPRDTPGVKVERMLSTMGFLDAPGGHGEVSFTDVRVPKEAAIGGVGQAFSIAQARLGPGRVHHCMRLIGLAESALELACRRAGERVAFGKPLANLGGNRERIADARIAIDQARLLVLHAAWLLDEGSPEAIGAVSKIKVAVPNMAQDVVDMAMQLHGGGGLSTDFPLAPAWTVARALRLADGPDEVHRGVIARLELARYGKGKWAG
jgi:acyl-CoA dehydrogenase